MVRRAAALLHASLIIRSRIHLRFAQLLVGHQQAHRARGSKLSVMLGTEKTPGGGPAGGALFETA